MHALTRTHHSTTAVALTILLDGVCSRFVRAHTFRPSDISKPQRSALRSAPQYIGRSLCLLSRPSSIFLMFHKLMCWDNFSASVDTWQEINFWYVVLIICCCLWFINRRWYPGYAGLFFSCFQFSRYIQCSRLPLQEVFGQRKKNEKLINVGSRSEESITIYRNIDALLY